MGTPMAGTGGSSMPMTGTGGAGVPMNGTGGAGEQGELSRMQNAE